MGAKMRRSITRENPFGADRYGYCWEAVRTNPMRGPHLDVGSYDATVPYELVRSELSKPAIAVDVVDVEGNFRAKHGSAPDGLHFVRLKGPALPFADSFFSSVSLLDVLEHIADQRGLLAEIWRVLRPGGLLVVTVPRKHLFSFLDTGNWKFVFPRLHRSYYVLRYSQCCYDDRYRNPESGLIGDIEIEKSWHEHFRPLELTRLLRSKGFSPQHLDGAGCFARPLNLASLAIPPLEGALGPVKRLDARKGTSTHLFSSSVKIG